MENIMDYIHDTEFEIYSSMIYKVIEISRPLFEIQKSKQMKSKHSSRISLINKSIFDYGIEVN